MFDISKVILTGEKRRMEHDMNARHLILRMNMLRCELRAVSFFLLSCPMLECLTFELGSEIILPVRSLSLSLYYFIIEG